MFLRTSSTNATDIGYRTRKLRYMYLMTKTALVAMDDAK